MDASRSRVGRLETRCTAFSSRACLGRRGSLSLASGSVSGMKSIDQRWRGPGSAMRIPVRETAIGRRSDELTSRSAHGYVSAMWVALGHLGLGDLDSLFQWSEPEILRILDIP